MNIMFIFIILTILANMIFISYLLGYIDSLEKGEENDNRESNRGTKKGK